jgi:hypothetical protein
LGALSAKDFQDFFHAPWSSKGFSDLARGDFWNLTSIPMLFVLPYGLYVLWRQEGARVASIVILAFLCGLAAWLVKDFHTNNPDAHAYVMFPITVLILCGMRGLKDLLSYATLQETQRGVFCACATIALLFPLLTQGFGVVQAKWNEGAEVLSRQLNLFPPASAVLVRSDHWVFPFWYRSTVEGRRPDVAIATLGMLEAKWYRRQLTRLHGSWEKRPKWTENVLAGHPTLSGYFWGPEPIDSTNSRTPFVHYCRSPASWDPFFISKSICSHVAVALEGDFKKQKRLGDAIRWLEQFGDLPPTNLACLSPRPLKLPFPLRISNAVTFLAHPEQPALDLAMLYSACAPLDMAARLLAIFTNREHVNFRLLMAGGLWKEGKYSQALEALTSKEADDSEAEILLAQARIALHTFASRK